MKNVHKDCVLIVDDSKENAAILFRLLTQTGFETLIAENGEKALQVCELTPPDLILLDVMMPGINGFEVCKQLKSEAKTQQIPIIFMTALSDTIDKIKAFTIGAADYITKPIQQKELLARVNAHLKLHKLKQQLQAQNIQLQQKTIELEKNNELIKLEKQKSDELLLNILPIRIAKNLKETGKTQPEYFENVTVLFSDMIDFTYTSSKLEPEILIDELNTIFTAFDNIIEKNKCERIKTIGDAYLCVCGLPEENPYHAENIVYSAIEFIDYLKQRNKTAKIKWEIRIGIHTGKVIAGIVGIKKYIYDVFGDTINITSRMESHSEAMKINISEISYHILKDNFEIIERGEIDVKGKGKMKMYFIKK
jgi:CheY-like chemotaxis protein/class 3 adenylate cyclase